MSFGLLTPIEPDDIPKVMRRIAEQYRSTQTQRYKHAWDAAADLLDKYAAELEPIITQIKRSEPRQRVRLDDPDDTPISARERRRLRRLARKQHR